MRKRILSLLKFICGTESGHTNQVNRTNLFSLITAIATIGLLGFTYSQIHAVKETTSADFALKLKTDIFSADNVTLISLLDDNALDFYPRGTNNGWFELDTDSVSPAMKIKNPPGYYTLIQIDQLLQGFENLSFYEQKGQIGMQYIFEQYGYYVMAIWKNQEIQEYIKMTRCQPHLCTSYINFENLYNEMKKQFNEVPCKNCQ